ncbi:MAG TPA: hypothetical protein VGX50_11715 [Longimicrobium sp.]|nr:hypothetical protein [Longimicrobium sp.]
MAEDLAACLWTGLRGVQRWAGLSAGERAGMFVPAAPWILDRFSAAEQEAPEIVPALHVLALLRLSPQRVSASDLARACHEIWRWADDRALLATAGHFAEAAAYIAADDPVYANDAGWACRRIALHERSAAWYQRGFALAVRARSRQESIRALLGYGALLKDAGRAEDARYFFDRASRRAARTGRRRQAAVARHYIFALEAETGDLESGIAQAREALNLYPIYDRRIPYLAHDYAFLLIRHRYYSRALSLLERLVPAISRPDEQVLVLSNVAWAAAGAGLYQASRQAQQRVLSLVPLHGEYAAAGLIHLAHAARLGGEWKDARRFAEAAVQTARARKEAALEDEALDLQVVIDARLPTGDEADPAGEPEGLESLHRLFTNRLRRWLAPDRRRAGAGASSARAGDLDRTRL